MTINVKTPAVFSSQPNFIILWDDCQMSVKQFIAAICLSLQFRRLWNVPKPLLIAFRIQFIRPVLSAIWNNRDSTHIGLRDTGNSLLPVRSCGMPTFITCINETPLSQQHLQYPVAYVGSVYVWWPWQKHSVPACFQGDNQDGSHLVSHAGKLSMCCYFLLFFFVLSLCAQRRKEVVLWNAPNQPKWMKNKNAPAAQTLILVNLMKMNVSCLLQRRWSGRIRLHI